MGGQKQSIKPLAPVMRSIPPGQQVQVQALCAPVHPPTHRRQAAQERRLAQAMALAALGSLWGISCVPSLPANCRPCCRQGTVRGSGRLVKSLSVWWPAQVFFMLPSSLSTMGISCGLIPAVAVWGGGRVGLQVERGVELSRCSVLLLLLH